MTRACLSLPEPEGRHPSSSGDSEAQGTGCPATARQEHQLWDAGTCQAPGEYPEGWRVRAGGAANAKARREFKGVFFVVVVISPESFVFKNKLKINIPKGNFGVSGHFPSVTKSIEKERAIPHTSMMWQVIYQCYLT